MKGQPAGAFADPPAWLEYLEHTADEGMAVRAPDLASLFARAAWGMFALLADPRAVRASEATPVAAAADDLETLLVRWLSELNYLHQVQGRLFCRFDVHTVDGQLVTADAWGEAIDPARHVVTREIKAVTFCGLCVERCGAEWLARVVFDL